MSEVLVDSFLFGETSPRKLCYRDVSGILFKEKSSYKEYPLGHLVI